MKRDNAKLRAGMVGGGRIFEETYAPFFEQAARQGLYDGRSGVACDVELVAKDLPGRVSATFGDALSRLDAYQGLRDPINSIAKVASSLAGTRLSDEQRFLVEALRSSSEAIMGIVGGATRGGEILALYQAAE